MTRISPLLTNRIKPTVHRGAYHRAKRLEVPHANIIRDPKKGEKPKLIPWFRCPDAEGHCS